MNQVWLNLILDLILLGLICYRVHKERLYETGVWLRISLCLGFLWLLLADVDLLVDPLSFPFITSNRGPGFRWIILAGVVVDLIRMKAYPGIEKLIAASIGELKEIQMADTSKLVWGIMIVLAALSLAVMAQLYLQMRGVDEEQSRRILEVERYQVENRWRIEILEKQIGGR